MHATTIQPLLVSILTSIITGGFILVFVEIGNRKNRENDRYEQIMRPFMHKLSAYFRFINWCSSRIKYPNKLNECEQEFKKLVKEIGVYGGRAVTSGGDYSIDYFSADELYKICTNKINNIWYYYDKMKPCNLSWEECLVTEEFISKELKEVFPHYLSKTRDINLVSNVSGDFYTDVYQPIENEIWNHKAYVEHFRRQTIFVSISVGFVLLVLVTLLFVQLTVPFMQVSGVVVVVLLFLCLLLLGVDTKVQIRYYYKLFGDFKDMEKDKIIKKKIIHLLLDSIIPVGLILAAWAILCVELEIIPKISVPWKESVVLGLNRLFLNLAYSYIAGVIVCLLIVKLPSLRNKIK